MRFLHKNIKKERKSMNEKKEFKPYIPADKVMPELTVKIGRASCRERV